MGWGNVTGDEKLLPTSGSNEIILEDGKIKKVRLIMAQGEEPYSFFQHTLENDRMEGGQSTHMFQTVNCPKTKQNPYAPCKLCDGQQAQRRVRHAGPAFDYEQGVARFLAGGDKIWGPIGTLHKMGIDPTTVDWGLLRNGKGRNDTNYSVQNLGVTPFSLPEGMNNLQDVRIQYKPDTEEEMRAIVESMGLDWAKLIVPPALQYPASLQIALDHVVPNTKYKGQTMKQIWDTNRGMIEFFAKSDRMSPEKANAHVILVALGGAIIEGVPNYGIGARPNVPPVTQPVQPPVDMPPINVPPVVPTVGGVSNQDKINSINKLLQSNQKFVAGGYQVIIDTMKQASGGKVSINEFTTEELDKMLDLCK